MPDNMRFNPGFEIWPSKNPIGFYYGDSVFGPQVENRRLEDIRRSLFNPYCEGPEIVYAIAMGVGKKVHEDLLKDLHLLYGAVTYAAGKLGNEPVRSQGHVHKVSSFSQCSTPEVYEIWEGKAVIYMQEQAEDFPGKCFAVYAQPGDVVIVPPGWVHATINADPEQSLTFGAWCVRDYGFDYEGVRRHQGIAWFPVFNNRNELEWNRNPLYKKSELICKDPENYIEFGIEKGISIYQIFERNPQTFAYVPQPQIKKEAWEDFTP
jgi:glucose-6-phosphate isomerase